MNLKHALVASACLAILASCTHLSESSVPAAGVAVTESRTWISLEPTSVPAKATGLMFYPGALVDPHAYVEILSRFSASGYRVVIAKMPANLAVLDAGAGSEARKDFPGVARWVLSGHSLGGAMACSAYRKGPEAWEGLVLLAGYAAKSFDISALPVPILSVSAQFDGLATPEKIDAALAFMPPATEAAVLPPSYPASGGYTLVHRIRGGCHAYFGSYGPQRGDGNPTITRAAQREETVLWMRDFFSHQGW